jgi:hypothetical protein
MAAAELTDLHHLRELFLAEHELAFVVGNPAGQHESVIYITDDPELGKLDLTIANNSAGPVEIGPESLLQIFVSPPLAEADVKRIKLAAGDWKLTLDEDFLELRCTSHLTIASHGKLTISLAAVMASGEPRTGFFQFEYSHFTGIADGSRRSPAIFIQRPPKSEAVPLVADLGARPEYAGQQGATVYVTPWNPKPPDKGIENHFIVQVANKRAGKAIPADSRLDSKIVISFTSGNSDLSVCLDDQIKVATCVMAQHPDAGPWEIAKDNTGPVPVWTMRPPKGADIFDAGGLIAFRFGGIVSQLPTAFASPMFIQFANIPGYNDGYAALILQKVPPFPYLRSYDAYSGTKKLAPNAIVDYKEKITLQWDVFAAERIRILELKQAYPPVGSLDVFPETSVVAYTLAPEIGIDPRNDWRKEQSLSVSAPVVAKLEASPDAVAPNTESELQWNCSNGSHCVLTGEGVKQENLPLVGSFPVTVQDTATFTITCVGAGSNSANVTVRVPTPEFKFTVDARKPNEFTTIWSSRYAHDCRVFHNGMWVGWGPEGTTTTYGEIPYFGFRVRVTVWGKGNASKEVKITSSNRYIEAQYP